MTPITPELPLNNSFSKYGDGLQFIINRIVSFFDPGEATSWNLVRVCKFFHKVASSILDPSCDDNKWLLWAIEKGNEAAVKRLLKDNRVNPSKPFNVPLLMSCEKGNFEIFKMLISDNRIMPSVEHHSSLYAASKFGHSKIVSELITNQKLQLSSKKKSPLVVASKKGHLQVVKDLLGHGHFFSTIDRGQALVQAAKFGYFSVVKELLEDVEELRNWSDFYGWIHLANELATEQGHTIIAHFLSSVLEKNATGADQ